MSECSMNKYIEMLDTDCDEQDVFSAQKLDMRDLITEHLMIEELELEDLQDAPPDLYEEAIAAEMPQRRKLKRDLEREALTRLETAARTVADYRSIISWWDRLDANRERRERYHEVLRSNDTLPLETGESPDAPVFPTSLNPVLARQLRRGDFLDAIYYCPYDIQELVSDDYVYRALKKLPEDRKQLLFLRAVEFMSSAQVGAIRGQSDRNIRKIWGTLRKKLRKTCAEVLTARRSNGKMLTRAELQFLREYYGEES